MDIYYHIILISSISTIKQLAQVNKALYQFLSQKYVWLSKFQLNNLKNKLNHQYPYQWIREYNLIKFSHDKINKILRKIQKPFNRLENGVIIICRPHNLSVLNFLVDYNANVTGSFIYFMLQSITYIQVYLFSKNEML